MSKEIVDRLWEARARDEDAFRQWFNGLQQQDDSYGKHISVMKHAWLSALAWERDWLRMGEAEWPIVKPKPVGRRSYVAMDEASYAALQAENARLIVEREAYKRGAQNLRHVLEVTEAELARVTAAARGALSYLNTALEASDDAFVKLAKADLEQAVGSGGGG